LNDPIRKKEYDRNLWLQPEYRRKRNITKRNWYAELRRQVILGYGGKCTRTKRYETGEPKASTMALHIEKTTSWQVEGPGNQYCLTAYSKHDALLGMRLARGIPGLKCLDEGVPGKQPKGIYIFLKDPKTGRTYPELEVYDRRLATRIRANLSKFKGDF